jgi:hypothetical protein
MPTDLPNRSRIQSQNDDSEAGWQALLIFYGSAGLAVLLLIAIERQIGMFAGLSIAESIYNATGVQVRNDGIDPFWASSPPL